MEGPLTTVRSLFASTLLLFLIVAGQLAHGVPSTARAAEPGPPGVSLPPLPPPPAASIAPSRATSPRPTADLPTDVPGATRDAWSESSSPVAPGTDTVSNPGGGESGGMLLIAVLAAVGSGTAFIVRQRRNRQ